MDQLARGLAISMSGPLRDRALTRVRTQIEQWNIALPAIEPLVLDFGLGDFDRFGLVEYWIANEVAAGYCGKYLFVFAGQTCPRHRHRIKHETFFVVAGRVEVECGGEVAVLQRGDRLPVAAGRWHRFTGREAALVLELSTPCLIDDNYFEDPAIPFGGNTGSIVSGRCSSFRDPDGEAPRGESG